MEDSNDAGRAREREFISNRMGAALLAAMFGAPMLVHLLVGLLG